VAQPAEKGTVDQASTTPEPPEDQIASESSSGSSPKLEEHFGAANEKDDDSIDS